jgi:hypothetical protein
VSPMNDAAVAHEELAKILSRFDEPTQRFLVEGLLAKLNAPAPGGPALLLIRSAEGRLLDAVCSVCDGKSEIALIGTGLEHRTVRFDENRVYVHESDSASDTETTGVICRRCWNELEIHDNDLQVLLEDAHWM